MDYLGYKKLYSFIHGGLNISQHYSREGSSMMTRAVLVVMGVGAVVKAVLVVME